MSDSPQYNKVYDINSLFAEMFSFLFLMLTRLQCLLMALNVTMDTRSVTNGYSVLENNVCQVQLFKLSYSKKCAVYYVEICTVMFVKTI